jgi:hypothetical protein
VLHFSHAWKKWSIGLSVHTIATRFIMKSILRLYSWIQPHNALQYLLFSDDPVLHFCHEYNVRILWITPEFTDDHVLHLIHEYNLMILFIYLVASFHWQSCAPLYSCIQSQDALDILWRSFAPPDSWKNTVSGCSSIPCIHGRSCASL